MAAADDGRLTKERITDIKTRHDMIVGDGLAYHRALPPLPSKRKRRPKLRPGRTLVNCRRDFKTEILRFLDIPAVPAKNTIGEQDPRCSKVKWQISDSFQTVSGMEDFAILHSSIENALHSEGRCRAGDRAVW